MSELTRLRIELNNLKQQVKYLLASNKGSGGGIPVKVKGLWNGVYFNVGSNEVPLVTSNNSDTGDIFVADVHANGLWDLPSSTVLVKRVPSNEQKKIEADTVFFAVKAVKEVAGNNVIPYYILESTGNSSVPVKILNKIAGNTYSAEIYENGLDDLTSFTSGEVEQASINSDQTIPNGAWAIASLSSNGIYYMQVPVWL